MTVGQTEPIASLNALNDPTDKLAALIKSQKQHILDAWRKKVREINSAKDMSDPIINDEIPKLIDEVVLELQTMTDGAPRSQKPGRELADLKPQAVNHGEERYRAGFSVMEVVREYSLLRETISDATEAGGIPLSGSCSRTVHRAINSAIGIAVQAFTLEKANELRARREENVAFIVHDLKTPLNAINLAARMIEESLVTDPSLASEMLQLILRNSARMETMLQKILKTEKALKSGVEAHLERREFDLWPLVQSVIDEMQTLATDAETKILNLIPRNSSVYADAVSLVTIFQNLLSNALKYTVCGKVSIRSKILDGAIEVCVEDTGEGIPETRMERLFLDREADPNKKGSTGLGLSIVQKAIEAHGGKLTVDSKVGKGTTFRFTLPNA